MGRDEAFLSPDGLVIPSAIPCEDIVPEHLYSAAIALDKVGASFSGAADGVIASWAGVPEAFVAPDAEVVYSAMAPATASAREFVAKLAIVSGALRVYADEVMSVKSTLRVIKGEAESFIERLVDRRWVWVPASQSEKYAYDTSTRGSSARELVAYLKTRGESVRDADGVVEILVPWTDSRPHVHENTALIERAARALEELRALQEMCASAISSARDHQASHRGPFDAPQSAAPATEEMAWGKKVDEDRNCTESFAGGTLDSVGSLLGRDPSSGEWFKGDAFKNAWAGVGSVGLMLVPGAPVLGALGVPVFSGALDHTVAIGKGMVSAARWRDNPAETSGELSAEGGVQLMTADVRIDMMTAGVAKVELSSADLASLVPTILLSGSHVELIGVTVDGDDVVDPYDAVTGEEECEETTE